METFYCKRWERQTVINKGYWDPGKDSHRRALWSLREGQVAQSSINLPGGSDSRAEIWTNRVCCHSTLWGRPLLVIRFVLATHGCCQELPEVRKEKAVGWGNVRNKIQPVLLLVFPERLTWQHEVYHSACSPNTTPHFQIIFISLPQCRILSRVEQQQKTKK